MGEAVATAGVVNQVGLVLRTAPAYRALADLVAAGGLGRPMAAVFTDDQYLPNQGQYASAWRADVEIAGGGTLLEHSIHDLDVLRWLLGDVVSVTGRTAAFAGHPGIEDLAVATLSFADGATASLTSVWHQVLSRPSTRFLQVIGEDGLAWVGNEYTGPLHVQTSAGLDERPCAYEPWVGDLPIEDPAWRRYAGQYAPATLDFLRAASSGAVAFPGFDVAVAAHRVADAVYRSAEAGGAPVQPALST
jgi:predicted dehydrogenase